MTPSSTECNPNQLNFGTLNGRKIIANFEGGRITSDAGIVLIAELDKKLEITAKFAKCFQDYRHKSYIDYSVHQLLAQRVYGIILGYEDVNNHDLLRYEERSSYSFGKIKFY
jgi:hypothetical protein